MKKLIYILPILALTGCGTPRATMTIIRTAADGLFNTAETVITQVEFVSTNTVGKTVATVKKPFQKKQAQELTEKSEPAKAAKPPRPPGRDKKTK